MRENSLIWSSLIWSTHCISKFRFFSFEILKLVFELKFSRFLSVLTIFEPSRVRLKRFRLLAGNLCSLTSEEVLGYNILLRSNLTNCGSPDTTLKVIKNRLTKVSGRFSGHRPVDQRVRANNTFLCALFWSSDSKKKNFSKR